MRAIRNHVYATGKIIETEDKRSLKPGNLKVPQSLFQYGLLYVIAFSHWVKH